MATKLALQKAFEAGQAAQFYRAPASGNPFDPNTQEEEHDAWNDGFSAEIEEKWFTRDRLGGQALTQEIES